MFSLDSFIRTAGYLGVFAAIFAESGLLVGIILPGDSLLFVAGFLASQHYMNIYVLAIVAFLAAVLGDNVGYWLGERFGVKIFSHRSARFLNQDQLKRTEAFFVRHGGKTILLSRFTPIVRTIAPVMAGTGKMAYRKFVGYNLIGGLLWAVGVSVLGYFLGSRIPNIDHYLLPGVVAVIIISLLPSVIHLWLSGRKSRRSAS